MAPPPDPHWPPAAGGSTPKPPKQPPSANFWLRACVKFKLFNSLEINGLIIAVRNFQTFSDCSFVSAYEPIFTLKLDQTVKCNFQNTKGPP